MQNRLIFYKARLPYRCAGTMRWMFLLLLLAISPWVVLADMQDAPDDVIPQTADGIRDPTPEELEWAHHNMIRVRRVRPNALGLERINAERMRRGKSPLALPAS